MSVRRLIVAVAALAMALLTARLGVWQLDRAAQKNRLQAEIEQRGALPPLAPEALARDTATAATQHQRRIRVHGRWLTEHTVYLDNRQMDGRPGFFVVTPLLLAPGDAVLVQRGWVPRDNQQRERLVPVATPDGAVSLLARVVPPPSALLAMGPEGRGPIRQNLDLARFAVELGVALRPLSLQQLDEAAAVAGDAVAGPVASPAKAGAAPASVPALQRHWPRPAADVAKHHGYAAQWFALCLLIVGLYVWFQLIRPRRTR